MNHRHRIFERLAGQLEYEDFYDIAAYGNENWKGGYTPKEVAQNAYDYYSDFMSAKQNGFIPKGNITYRLIMLLVDDGSEYALELANRIVDEIYETQCKNRGEQ